jgi:hypothetical protein
VHSTITEAYRSEFEYGSGKVSGVDYLPEENSMPARYYLTFGSSGPDVVDAQVGSPSLQTVIEDATLFHGKKCSFSFWFKGNVLPLGGDTPNRVKLRIWQYLGITGGAGPANWDIKHVANGEGSTGSGHSVLNGPYKTQPGTGRPHTAPNPVTTNAIVFGSSWQKFSGSITLPSVAGVSTPEGEGATAGVGCLGCEFLVSTDDEGWEGEFSIAQFQFEVGGAVTKFEQKSYQQEIENCQRYFATTYTKDVIPSTSNYDGCEVMRAWDLTTARDVGTSYNYPQQMRMRPYPRMWGAATGVEGYMAPGDGGVTERARIHNSNESGLMWYGKTVRAQQWYVHITVDADF